MLDRDTRNSYDKNAANWSFSSGSGLKYLYKHIINPNIYPLVSDIKAKNVLCLGAGTGEEIVKLICYEPKKIIAIDASSGMVEQMRKLGFDEDLVEILNLDFDDLDAHDFGITFDLVFANMSLHYTSDLERLFHSISKIMSSDGVIIFSMNHPLFSSFEKSKDGNFNFKGIGYKKDLNNGSVEVIGNYYNSEIINSTWNFGRFTYRYFHHTMSSIVNALINNRFQIEIMLEPNLARAEMDKKYYEYIPSILIIKAKFI